MPFEKTTADPLPVLVVDDDSTLIRTLSDILRLHGFDPETAETGRRGLELAEDRPPALAVVDLRLPDMDGIELVAKLHELSDRTEVVVLTGNASLESAVAALRQNSIDYLLKPVQVEQLLQVVGAARDRWRRRRAEHALHVSEERYRMLFDRNPQPVWVYDRATLRFLAVNDATVARYGYSRDEFLGMTIEAIRPAEEAAAVRRVALADSVRAPRVWRHCSKSGELFDVEVTSHDVDFAERPARLVLGVDVTQRMAAQRALESRARQQEAVARFGQRAIDADDLPRLLADATALVAETLDVPLASVLERQSDGRTLVLRGGFGWPPPDASPITVPIVPDTQAGFTIGRNDSTIVTDMAQEERFRQSQRLLELGVASGMTVPVPGPVQPYGVLATYDRRPRAFTRDDLHFLQAIAHVIGAAVEKHRADLAFRQAQRLEAVGRLASGVAHDFNNMLTAITGYAEMVRAGLPRDDALREDIAEILNAAGRAAGLTRQLLAFSRQQVLQPRVLMLNDVVEGIRKMLLPLLGADVELDLRLGADLGFVKADPGQIEQVIMNLSVNARDAMPDGGTLTIETANLSLDPARTNEMAIEGGGAFVALRVTDTGTGMDAETQARLFEPFFTTKPADRGTGLGLATVYGIVKQSGGEIHVESEPGQGSTFAVVLPRLDDASAMEAAVAASRETGGTETILLVDDEDAIREVARRVLQRAGYRLLVATSGQDALAQASAFTGTIHLLATDLMMPGMSGTQLAEALRGRDPALRVLMLSGYAEVAAPPQRFAATTRFLQKPFASASLTRAVRDLLDAPVPA